MLRARATLSVAVALAAGCSAGNGDIVERPGAQDAGGGAPRDAGATDVPTGTRPDTGAPRDTGTAPADVPRTDTGVAPGTDAGTVVGMDSGTVVGMDSGTAVGMDVAPPLPDVPWTPPDVPPLDVAGATLDADVTPHDTTLTLAGAPADSAGRFTGSLDPSRAPSLVYPADGTIVPPNLPSFEVHFNPGAGNTLFAVTFTGDRGTVTAYTGCTAVGGGCVATLTGPQFAEVARVAQPGGQVTLGVRGTAAGGGAYGSAATRTLGVTATVLHGGLYYWAAASGTVLRYDWDLAGARPEAYLSGDPINCVGCHVLSRDGRRAAVGRFIPGPSQMVTLDVASRHPLSPTFGANFASFSPDDARVLVSDGARLWVADGASGAGAPGLPGGFVGSMPDWARDGRRAVFSRPHTVPPLFGSPGHGAPADVMLMTWVGAGFGPAAPLVQAHGENNYYPAFSPDGQWVLFDRSAADSYNAIDAHLWSVPADGSGAPVHLAAADGTGDLGNSWPKWAPFAQMYQGEPLMWLTFASRRDYGLRIQQQSRTADTRTAQLWMAAFRPGRSAGGGDPTAPAFWLPMQDPGTGNHIGQWSEAVLRQGCASNADCAPTESCQTTNRGMACVGVTH